MKSEEFWGGIATAFCRIFGLFGIFFGIFRIFVFSQEYFWESWRIWGGFLDVLGGNFGRNFNEIFEALERNFLIFKGGGIFWGGGGDFWVEFQGFFK